MMPEDIHIRQQRNEFLVFSGVGGVGQGDGV
jgi:hypothetical protein